ncbi:hypothetical protein [Peribacillus frigoritolerans]|nr:hypothetical protein [Peribacillus frigoritolerans]
MKRQTSLENWFKELRQYIPHEKSEKGNGYNIYKSEGIERFKEIQAKIGP